tara:strand:+ start:2594 stop:2914 length:321 start_codon:yes stop_codon:yes gene_type:complete
VDREVIRHTDEAIIPERFSVLIEKAEDMDVWLAHVPIIGWVTFDGDFFEVVKAVHEGIWLMLSDVNSLDGYVIDEEKLAQCENPSTGQFVTSITWEECKALRSRYI